jgi:hypothetical protein
MAGYLAALAVALAFADLGVPATVGLMLTGWVLVAAVEWTWWRRTARFGAGMPPAWQAPRVTLPAPRPLEQLVQGYPDSVRDEGATWIASAAVREELFGAWPVAADTDETWAPSVAEPEDTQPAVVRTSRHHVDPASSDTTQFPIRPAHRALPRALEDRGR